jgi:DNA polymerase III alpha subunit
MIVKTDKLGTPIFTTVDLVNMIYSGHAAKVHLVQCEDTSDVQQFNAVAKERYTSGLQVYNSSTTTMVEFDNACQSDWFMPDEYLKIDIYDHLVRLCSNQNEINRLTRELEEYQSRNMINILRYMIFLVDFMRENKIVWGVGRGSSVASFVLYLIGVHKIHSIQYGLDFNEFMR